MSQDGIFCLFISPLLKIYVSDKQIKIKNNAVEAQSLGNAGLLQGRAARMTFCVFGILSAFVLYGLLQERIMTQPYGEEEVYFKSSAYLVLNNRIVAMILAIVIMRFRGESLVNAAPIHKCASISVSNTLATYCQYEALKYVSFPTQTLGKCGKMIPVIILGLLIGGKKYTMNDFAIALLVTFGCTIFVTTGVRTFSSLQPRVYSPSLTLPTPCALLY